MAIENYLQEINNATSGPRQDVSNSAKDLANLQAGAGALPAKLKEALNTKLNNNADLINQTSETMQNYFNSGPEARNKYQNIFDPFKKAELVQQARSMALRPYDTLSGILENRMGQVSDIVGAGVQGWQGLVDAATTKMDLAKSNLSTALQAYVQAADMQQAADELAERQRQFGITSDQEQQKINNQSSQFDRDLAARLAIAKLSSGGGVRELSPADQLALGRETIQAMGAIEKGKSDGTIKNSTDVRQSLMSAGFDPNDAKFSYLYSFPEQTNNTKMQDNLSNLWNNTKYWLSSGGLK